MIILYDLPRYKELYRKFTIELSTRELNPKLKECLVYTIHSLFFNIPKVIRL